MMLLKEGHLLSSGESPAQGPRMEAAAFMPRADPSLPGRTPGPCLASVTVTLLPGRCREGCCGEHTGGGKGASSAQTTPPGPLQ
jgi:hypothetical protein